MSLRYELQRILSVLLPLSIAAFVYLYLYPIFHGCAFPSPSPKSSPESLTSSSGFIDTFRDHVGFLPEHTPPPRFSPFRLLVLADPQIEGDSSLPTREYDLDQRIISHWEDIKSANTALDRLLSILRGFTSIVADDIPRSLRAARKRLDLFGNDFYLAHIYRTLRWWTRPTHITVLGDLIGSQWVSDDEFDARSRRYWNRVFSGGVRVDDEITVTGAENYDSERDKVGLLRLNDSSWSNRIINIAGNHDVGYAGDITEDRIARFDREFGRANWDVRFEHFAADSGEVVVADGENPSLHLIVLNTLAFDTPPLTPSVQSHTYTYLNDLIAQRSYPVEDRTSFTLLLTHLPLHKQERVCNDPPYFAFYEDDDEDYPEDETPRFKVGDLREQNHLSDYVSQVGILQGVFGMGGDRSSPAGGQGRNGLILTGHDHTGCDVVHFVDRNETQDADGSTDTEPGWSWNARRYSADSSKSSNENDGDPSIREVTLRSMMGEFGGNAGLLSLWFDSDPSVREWKYEITMCPLGAQHGWWAIHAVGIATIGVFLAWLLLPSAHRHGKVREEVTQATLLRKDNNQSPKKSGESETLSPKSRNIKADSKRSQRKGNSRRRN